MSAPREITDILTSLRRGDEGAIHELMPIVYPHLRRLARRAMHGQRPNHTLQPTAVVNEAYLRVIGENQPAWQNRAHFFGVAAQAMRRILIDHARARRTQKRGGEGNIERFVEIAAPSVPDPVDLLDLDAALTRLAEADSRAARVVELRYFGGLDREEVAEVLGVAVRTADRDWRYAKGWLRRALSEPQAQESSDGT